MTRKTKPSTTTPVPAVNEKKALTELAEVLPEAEAGYERALASDLQPRMLSALKRVAQGEAVREAARLEGYRSHSTVYKHAKRFALLDVRTQAIVTLHKHVAKLAVGELELRLLTDPDNISTHALSVIGGISTDKVLMHEKQAKDDGGAWMSAFEKTAARIIGSGVELKLSVTLTPKADHTDDNQRESAIIDVSEVKEIGNGDG